MQYRIGQIVSGFAIFYRIDQEGIQRILTKEEYVCHFKNKT